MRSPRAGLVLLALATTWTVAAVGMAGPGIQLAIEGDAELPVVVGPSASEQVQSAAQTLADYLAKISGGTFEVAEGDGTTGIAVGTPDDFPALADLAERLDATGLARRDQYLLHTHTDGLHVLGATPLAVQHGVWDLLYRLGHRQFFPGPTWEVIPDEPNLSIEVDVVETPDYFNRRGVWYTHGTFDYFKNDYDAWMARNRGPGDFILKTGHAWGGIYRRHREVFQQHPEYLALVEGERIPRGRHGVPDADSGRGTKFCVSNPQLRELVVEDRLEQMSPDDDSIAMDPSDYGGWCECEDCAEIGGPSNHVTLLANEVAEAIVDRYGPDKYVGIYAYHHHAAPPTIEVHPNVIVSVATMFIRDGLTLEGIIEGWERQGATIGIREYYARFPTSLDLPGQDQRAARVDYLTDTIPRFYRMGARFMSGQSLNAWAPYGPGYYLIMRMLWDVDEANRADELLDDFFDKAFGSAQEPMRQLYDRYLYTDDPVLLSEDLVGRMYRLLDEALHATDDPAIEARIRDLALYTRYLDLHRQFTNASDDRQRRERLGEMLRHSWRIRDTHMVHVVSHFGWIVSRVAGLDDLPDEVDWDVPESQNPWKPSERGYTAAQVAEMLTEGIAGNELIDFEPARFSRHLRPMSGELPIRANLPRLDEALHFDSRGTMNYYVWVAESPADVELAVTGGMIAHYRNRGDVQIHLYAPEALDGDPIDTAAVPPDGETRQVRLKTDRPGLHRVWLHDGMDSTRVSWPRYQPVVTEASSEWSPRLLRPSTIYFYVPGDTEVVGGHHDGTGEIHNSRGEVVHTFEGENAYFSIAVPPEQRGSVWSMHGFRGSGRTSSGFRLMTVPPFVALEPAGLMLPKELLEKERR